MAGELGSEQALKGGPRVESVARRVGPDKSAAVAHEGSQRCSVRQRQLAARVREDHRVGVPKTRSRQLCRATGELHHVETRTARSKITEKRGGRRDRIMDEPSCLVHDEHALLSGLRRGRRAGSEHRNEG